MPLHESKSNAEPAATAKSAACAASDSNRKSRLRVGIAIGFRRPRMQILHNQHRISIFDIVEVLDLCLRQFSNDRHFCSFDNGCGIEKLLMNREEPSLRLLTVENRSLVLIQGQLQKLDLCPIFQSFRLQHLATEYHDLALV